MFRSSCRLLGSLVRPSRWAWLAKANSCFRFSSCCFFISGSSENLFKTIGLTFATSARSISTSCLLMLLNEAVVECPPTLFFQMTRPAPMPSTTSSRINPFVKLFNLPTSLIYKDFLPGSLSEPESYQKCMGTAISTEQVQPERRSPNSDEQMPRDNLRRRSGELHLSNGRPLISTSRGPRRCLAP